jgi:sterol 3beta-glucosyltransferase
MMDVTSGHGARIALLTYGTRGDVEPFIALAAGLQRAGYRPRLAAPGVFAPLAQDHGVPFQPLPGDPAQLAKDMVAMAGTSWPRMVVSVSRFVAPLAAQVSRIAIECAAGADIIVHSFLMTQSGYEIARLQGIPSVSAQFFPVFAPTTSFPAVVFPDLRLGGLYRRLTHVFVTQVFWHGSRLLYGRVRRAEPTLPGLSGWPFSAPGPMRPKIAFAFSRHVIPPPSDWAGVAEVTGYWPLNAPAGWRPPIDLDRFLDSGPPPIFIGLGSGGSAEGGAWIEAARIALQECGARGILDLGSNDGTTHPLPSTIFAVRGLPHAWLFPRVAAVVHHGGAGTTGAGLMAGRPTAVVPTTSDQPFWGRRVQSLGVGPRPIPVRRLTADKLAQSISAVITDPDMQARAKQLGERIRAEDGIGTTVRLVSQLLGR